MNIESIHIRNFRKLKNCHIDFDDMQTIFVGANNSGKTSAISAIVWFLENKEKFTVREFTATNWSTINDLGDKWIAKDTVNEVLLSPHLWDDVVPSMDIWISVNNGEQYRVNHLIPSLSTWEGKTVGVRCLYTVKDTKALFEEYKKAKDKAKALENTKDWESARKPELYPQSLHDFLAKGSNLHDYFDVKYFILDSAKKSTNEDETQSTPNLCVEGNPLAELVKVDCILASRDFSDTEGHRDNEIDTLSMQFHQYYKNTNQDGAELLPGELGLVKSIEEANRAYDEKLSKAFAKPVDELKGINYPGFQNPAISIHSVIEIEQAIRHESAVQFAILGQPDLRLPEKYNGLGFRNLISMSLKLMEFRDKWLSKINEGKSVEPIHLVFVEEPEAHLHAQAQQVFARKAFEALCKNDILRSNTWLHTQLVISTHSNHIVNELDLNCMRYFRRVMDAKDKIPVTKVVNMSNTFGADDDTRRFVTRYIRLTHCDLLFADAVILVEGPAEKILIPSFLKKAGLDTYYISVIEVNGRHAYSFRSIIERVGIPSLVVTDIDAVVKKKGKDGREYDSAEMTAKGKGYKTGNPSIKRWLKDKETIEDLLALDSEGKVVGNVRLAYQTPVNVKWDSDGDDLTEICPYTFEDALIMTNLCLFRNEKLKRMGAITTISKLLKESSSALDLQTKIFNALEAKGRFSKADFANSLLYTEEFEDLTPPEYISDGLKWLKECLDGNGAYNGK